MATLLNLVKSAQKVLPVAFGRIGDGQNNPIKSVRVQEFVGMKTIQILSVQKKSGRFPTSKRPAGSTGFYKQNIKFIFENREDIGARLPSSTSDNAKVRCGCDSYYYYFWWWNKKQDAHSGGDFTRYERKTTTMPEKNPQHLPGMCKHLLFLVRELRKAKVIR